MKIGILVPLQQELPTLTVEKIVKGNCINISDQILVAHTGMGWHNTFQSAKQLLAFGVDQLIGWGTAAGLSPTVAAGDLIIPDAVIISEEKYSTHHEFNNKILKHIAPGLRWHKGLIYGANEVLDSVESKQEIFAKTRCIGADMESGALAQAAIENKVPFTIIRAVSDPVYQSIPKSVEIGLEEDGGFNTKKFIKAISSRPQDWLPMVKLARNFKKARKTLNIVAEVIKDQT